MGKRELKFRSGKMGKAELDNFWNDYSHQSHMEYERRSFKRDVVLFISMVMGLIFLAALLIFMI